MRVVAVLEGARDLILAEGWAQGTYFSDGEGRCVVRACWDAAQHREHLEDVEAKLLLNDCMRFLRANAGIPNLCVWNDAEDRTLQQVLETFGRAINDAELVEMQDERMMA